MIFLLNFRWFCHFDDDNYVNVQKLVDLLKDFSPSVDWYLGKPSIASPLEIFIDNVSHLFDSLHFLHMIREWPL